MKPGFFRRAVACLKLCVIFLRELMLSSWSVARAVFASDQAFRSAVIAVPIRVKTDMGIATLANLISLTPGTTSLYVGDDRKCLYVHCLDVDSEEEIVNGIRGAFEDTILVIEG
ncbi:Na+/H+ antiporter subunit E [Pusillimonas sp.]|uniref:Na+/H+ antiporter subunit E n=1 Tax=Pusillimonas sp. TaxID=3040095 RepID=UPI0037CC74B3